MQMGKVSVPNEGMVIAWDSFDNSKMVYYKKNILGSILFAYTQLRGCDVTGVMLQTGAQAPGELDYLG